MFNSEKHLRETKKKKKRWRTNGHSGEWNKNTSTSAPKEKKLSLSRARTSDRRKMRVFLSSPPPSSTHVLVCAVSSTTSSDGWMRIGGERVFHLSFRLFSVKKERRLNPPRLSWLFSHYQNDSLFSRHELLAPVEAYPSVTRQRILPNYIFGF